MLIRFVRTHQTAMLWFILLFFGLPMALLVGGGDPFQESVGDRIAARVQGEDVSLRELAAQILMPPGAPSWDRLLGILEAHKDLETALDAGVGSADQTLDEQVAPDVARDLRARAERRGWTERHFLEGTLLWARVRARLEGTAWTLLCDDLGLGGGDPASIVPVSPEEVHRLRQQVGDALTEDRIRREIAQRDVMSLLNALLLQSAQVSHAAAYPAYLQERQDRRVRAVEFDAQAYAPADPADEEALRAFYEGNRDLPPAPGRAGYRLGERVILYYVVADREALAPEIEIPEEELRAFYDGHAERWAPPAAPPEDPGTPAPDTPPSESDDPPPPAPQPRTYEEARDEILREMTAERIERLIRRRMDAAYEALATRQPPASAEETASQLGLQTGLLGPVGRDELAEAAAFGSLGGETTQKVFASRPGRWSTQTTCARGVFLFRVQERLDAGPAPFEEVREQVARDLARQRGFETAKAAADATLASARANGLAEAVRGANRAGLADDAPDPDGPARVVETGWFRRDDPAVDGIGDSRAFREAAFSLPEPPAREPGSATGEEGIAPTPSGAQVSEVVADSRAGRCWLVELLETRAPDPQGFAEYYARARGGLDQQARWRMREAWREHLMSQVEILP